MGKKIINIISNEINNINVIGIGGRRIMAKTHYASTSVAGLDFLGYYLEVLDHLPNGKTELSKFGESFPIDKERVFNILRGYDLNWNDVKKLLTKHDQIERNELSDEIASARVPLNFDKVFDLEDLMIVLKSANLS